MENASGTITLNIDGRDVETKPGISVLDVSLNAGTYSI